MLVEFEARELLYIADLFTTPIAKKMAIPRPLKESGLYAAYEEKQRESAMHAPITSYLDGGEAVFRLSPEEIPDLLAWLEDVVQYSLMHRDRVAQLRQDLLALLPQDAR